MSSGYQIGNLEPDYGRVTTEEEIKRRARCGIGSRRETSGYSMCAAQPAQLDMPAALLPSAQTIIGGGIREDLTDDPKNEIALKMVQMQREQIALLQIIAVVLVVLAVLYAAMCIESSLMGSGHISGGHSHRGRYCAECGGVV